MKAAQYVVRWIFVWLLCTATLEHKQPHPHKQINTKLPPATLQIRLVRTHTKVVDAMA